VAWNDESITADKCIPVVRGPMLSPIDAREK
jgi:hypothetical protein